MTLSHLPVRFHLHFDRPAHADNPPLFVLRSMLGKHLHAMSCISQQTKCPECMYKNTCAYAFLFETILPQENETVLGRDRASHPFAFTVGRILEASPFSDYDFTITLFGKACEYLPYVYAAFVRAGKDGLFKERRTFSVTEVSVGKTNILIDSEHLNVPFSPHLWHYDETQLEKSGKVLVELRSPLRFKYGGKYGVDFTAKDFFCCLYRRMRTLCLLYGAVDTMAEYSPHENIHIFEKNMSWKDFRHYSARQKIAMTLGGASGSFKLEGTFSAIEQNLLEFARLANAGKNTNFGLGQMDFWAKWE